MPEETAGREKQTRGATAGAGTKRVWAALAVIRGITGRKRAKETLREDEERFRSLFEASFEGICIHEKGVILDANPAFVKMAGYSLSEVVGMPVLDLVAEESRDPVMQKIRSGAQGPYEAVGLRKDGTTFGAEIIGKTHTYRGRRVRVTALRDITERKRAEEALRESDQRFRSFFEYAATGMALVATDGRILQVNRVCCEVLGYSEQELTSMTWQAISHPDDVDIMRDRIERILAGEADSVQYEKRYLHKRGHVLWGFASSTLLRDADGRPLYLISQIQDITERKRAEEALRESEQRYRAVFEQAADSLLLFEAETGAVVEFNDRAHETLGYSREEFEKLKIADFEASESAEEVAKHLAKVVREGADSFETKHRTKGGEILDVEVRCKAISVGGRDYIETIFHDITKRKRMEQALQSAREELEARVEHQMLRRNPYRLTFRELTLLHLVAAGESDKEIGTTLGISPLTAQKHISNIMGKMGASSRTEAGVRAVREGLLD